MWPCWAETLSLQYGHNTSQQTPLLSLFWQVSIDLTTKLKKTQIKILTYSGVAKQTDLCG